MTIQSENKTIAVIFSLLLHLILIVCLFYFVLRTPNPPYNGGSGVVFNIGFVDEGTGEIQTLNDANDSKIEENNKTQVDDNEPKNIDQIEEKESTPTENKLITSTEESDLKIEDKKEKIPVENKLKNTESNNKEVTKTTKEQKANPAALFGGNNGESNKGGNNNGDKAGAIGDQGKPDGDINAKALYGNAGNGGDGAGGTGGTSLDLAGWKWDKKPKVKDDNEDENGKIIYQITIDDQGELVNLKLVETTVSPAVEKIYRKEVEKLSFIKTDNKTPASTSTGRITFIIKIK